MGKKIDPRDFLLNTDYEMDKIIFCQKLKLTISSTSNHVIQHKLATVPLTFGVWSLNEDMTNCHEFGITQSWEDDPHCYSESDLTNITLHLKAKKENGNYVSTTMYIYVFGFEPGSNFHSTSTLEQNAPTLTHKKLPTTSKNAKVFIINTDYNYLKLIANNPKLEYSSELEYRIYGHNLGYLPQVLTWSTFGWDDYGGWNITFFGDGQGAFSYDDSNSGEPGTSGYNYKSGFFVDDKNVRYYGSGIVPATAAVRIYADEA